MCFKFLVSNHLAAQHFTVYKIRENRVYLTKFVLKSTEKDKKNHIPLFILT